MNTSNALNQVSLRDQIESLKKNAKEKLKKEESGRASLIAGVSMLGGNILSLLVQLLMVPVLVTKWGGAVYGEWVILTTISTYFTLTDVGLIAASSNRIDSFCAREMYLSANKTYATSLSIIGVLFSVVSLVAAFAWYQYGSLIAPILTSIEPEIVAYLYFMVVTDALVAIAYNHQTALYRSINRYYLTVNWQSAGRFLPYVAVCLIVLSGGEIFDACVTTVVVRMICFVLLGIDLRKQIVWIKFDWLRTTKSEVSKLLKVSGGFVALPIANMITLHVTTMIVAFTTTPSMVAAFTTIRTFTRLIPQFVSIGGRAFWSEITKNNARKNSNELNKIHQRVFRTTFTLAAAMGVGYLLLGEYVYMKWTRNEFLYDATLFVSMVFHGIAISIYTSLEVMVLAKNEVNKYSILFLTLSICQIGFGWLCLNILGLASFPIFGCIGAIAVCVYLFKATRSGVNQ